MLHYNAVKSKWWAGAISCSTYLVNQFFFIRIQQYSLRELDRLAPKFQLLASNWEKALRKSRKKNALSSTLKHSNAYCWVLVDVEGIPCSRFMTRPSRDISLNIVQWMYNAQYRGNFNAWVLRIRMQPESISHDESTTPYCWFIGGNIVNFTFDLGIGIKSVTTDQDDQVNKDWAYGS